MGQKRERKKKKKKLGHAWVKRRQRWGWQGSENLSVDAKDLSEKRREWKEPLGSGPVVYKNTAIFV